MVLDGFGGFDAITHTFMLIILGVIRKGLIKKINLRIAGHAWGLLCLSGVGCES